MCDQRGPQGLRVMLGLLHLAEKLEETLGLTCRRPSPPGEGESTHGSSEFSRSSMSHCFAGTHVSGSGVSRPVVGPGLMLERWGWNVGVRSQHSTIRIDLAE